MRVLSMVMALALLICCMPRYLIMEGEMDKVVAMSRAKYMKARRGRNLGAGISDYLRAIEE